MEQRNTHRNRLTHRLRTAIWLLALCSAPTLLQAQTYCSAGASSAGSAGITQVTFNTISNSSSSNPAYTNYTAQSTSVMQGSTHALSVTIMATGVSLRHQHGRGLD